MLLNLVILHLILFQMLKVMRTDFPEPLQKRVNGVDALGSMADDLLPSKSSSATASKKRKKIGH